MGNEVMMQGKGLCGGGRFRCYNPGRPGGGWDIAGQFRIKRRSPE